METSSSFFESLIFAFKKRFKDYKVPFLSAIVVGLIAHGFSFANKLVQQDDLSAFYGKGTSLSAGRWVLEVMDSIFPNYSMPWVNGLLALAFLAVAACLICSIAGLRDRILQSVTAGCFITISGIIGIFTQPYLSTVNAFAIFLSVIGVFFLSSGKEKKRDIVFGILFLVLSMGIYQAYICLASSLFIVLMLKQLLCQKKNAREVLKEGLWFVLYLLIAIMIYGAITLALNKLLHVEILSYAVSTYSIPKRLAVAYSAFAGFFFKGYFSFVNSTWSLLFHVVLLLAGAVLYIFHLREMKEKNSIALAVVCLFLLPLSINGMYLVSSVDVLGPLAVISFFCVYLLLTVLLDDLDDLKVISKSSINMWLRDISMCGLCVVIISNVFFSNEVYLKMYMQTSQLTSFYTGVMTQIMAEPEYDGSQTVVILGNPDNLTYSMDEIDTSNFIGLCSENVYDLYTKYNFIKYYLGYDLNFATFNEECNISALQEYQDMPVYPASGAIKTMDNYIVVKLGN